MQEQLQEDLFRGAKFRFGLTAEIRRIAATSRAYDTILPPTGTDPLLLRKGDFQGCP